MRYGLEKLTLVNTGLGGEAIQEGEYLVKSKIKSVTISGNIVQLNSTEIVINTYRYRNTNLESSTHNKKNSEFILCQFIDPFESSIQSLTHFYTSTILVQIDYCKNVHVTRI